MICVEDIGAVHACGIQNNYLPSGMLPQPTSDIVNITVDYNPA
jgi:hypothetical protein